MNLTPLGSPFIAFAKRVTQTLATKFGNVISSLSFFNLIPHNKRAYRIVALIVIVALGASFLSINTLFEEKTHFYTVGKYQISVDFNSNQPQTGNNRINILVTDQEGHPINAKTRVRAYDQGMNTIISPTIRKIQQGRFAGSVDLPDVGEWILAVDVDSSMLGHGDLLLVLKTGRKGLEQLTATQESIAYYTCSMHPSVKSATQGTCPICSMDLIAVKKKDKQAGVVTVNDKKRQLIGVTTAEVGKRPFIKTINAPGKISYDESRLTEITLKYDAWIEALAVKDIGLSVKKGEPLFNIYSPELISAQQEYLSALQSGDSYKTAAAERLKLWGVNAIQLKKLQRRGRSLTKLPILSPVTGVVVSKNIIQGTAVKSGAPLLRIADLSKVWLETSIYQSDLPWVKEGVSVEISVDDLPNFKWRSVVNRIDPFINSTTHTASLRMEVENKQGLLRPNMYASAQIQVDLGERLLIPQTSVIFSGEKRIVFRDLGHGELQPVTITTGLQNENDIEVLAGLTENDKIVSSGHFLIAAESKLKSGLKQW
ncbi:MAG: efflux RND transporter periplasmic adaptor subunit [Methylococcaceae bacterium]